MTRQGIEAFGGDANAAPSRSDESPSRNAGAPVSAPVATQQNPIREALEGLSRADLSDLPNYGAGLWSRRNLDAMIEDALSLPTPEVGWRDAVAMIAQTAHAIGCQAGVGGMETAGSIVSYLANHPDQIEPFFRGDISPVDWRDFTDGGCLTWHAKDGKIVHPSEVQPTPPSNEGEVVS